MSAQPNLDKLELIADALGDLRGQLVFVGGCAVDLLLTDPDAAPARWVPRTSTSRTATTIWDCCCR